MVNPDHPWQVQKVLAHALTKLALARGLGDTFENTKGHQVVKQPVMQTFCDNSPSSKPLQRKERACIVTYKPSSPKSGLICSHSRHFLLASSASLLGSWLTLRLCFRLCRSLGLHFCLWLRLSRRLCLWDRDRLGTCLKPN